jgi:hypothetical protein
MTEVNASPGAEAAKFNKLHSQIEIAEEELAILRKNKGDQLYAQNISRQRKYNLSTYFFRNPISNER